MPRPRGVFDIASRLDVVDDAVEVPALPRALAERRS
jgi:hypothetical protein